MLWFFCHFLPFFGGQFEVKRQWPVKQGTCRSLPVRGIILYLMMLMSELMWAFRCFVLKVPTTPQFNPEYNGDIFLRFFPIFLGGRSGPKDSGQRDRGTCRSLLVRGRCSIFDDAWEFLLM
jgi:hypothetical protein